MRDLAQKWPTAPDWSTARLDAGGIAVRTISGLSQSLVSGDLKAWAKASSMTVECAAGGVIASGDRYMARIARDRVLAVGTSPFSVKAGWHPSGFGVSSIDAGMHVFQIEGPGMRGILARAMTRPQEQSGPSASLLFAEINVVLYCFASSESVRVHVDRGLAPYLWEWLEQSVRL